MLNPKKKPLYKGISLIILKLLSPSTYQSTISYVFEKGHFGILCSYKSPKRDEITTVLKSIKA